MTDGNLRQIFAKHLPIVHWQSIETGGVGAGVPDVNYCTAGREGWIENKKTGAWKFQYAPAQIGWTERRLRAGGTVFLAVRRMKPTAIIPVDELWFFHGSQFRVAAEFGIRKAEPLFVFTGGPAGWDWNRIYRTLLQQENRWE